MFNKNDCMTLQKISANLPGALLIYRDNENEDIIFASDEIARIFECDSTDDFMRFTGGSFATIVYPEDIEEVEQVIQSHVNNFVGYDYVTYRIITKNGRTGLGLALQAYFDPGDKIVVNGFTCYAVIEAIEAAGMTPIYADIEQKTLNFDQQTLEQLFSDPVSHGAKWIIVQNSLGNPVDMKKIEKLFN